MMDENKTVSFAAFEAEIARNERACRRLFWAFVAAVIILVGTNVFWVVRFLL